MMALDSLNNLNKLPDNLSQFLEECIKRKVKEICVTGTNTDPLLYTKTFELLSEIRFQIVVPIAIRTNGILYNRAIFGDYDKASITVCSFDKEIYRKMMGSGEPPNITRILKNHPKMPIKVNIVMGPENVDNGDIFKTLDILSGMDIIRVNIREPYGQPHIGNPMPAEKFDHHTLGMPTYRWKGLQVTYWDVHYVEVESINLYANGRISLIYPITKGHDDKGEVHEQSYFPGGRIQEQWL
jgi:molybdenum cofactor biosynthesis enzyme MoaA